MRFVHVSVSESVGPSDDHNVTVAAIDDEGRLWIAPTYRAAKEGWWNLCTMPQEPPPNKSVK